MTDEKQSVCMKGFSSLVTSWEGKSCETVSLRIYTAGAEFCMNWCQFKEFTNSLKKHIVVMADFGPMCFASPLKSCRLPTPPQWANPGHLIQLPM